MQMMKIPPIGQRVAFWEFEPLFVAMDFCHLCKVFKLAVGSSWHLWVVITGRQTPLVGNQLR